MKKILVLLTILMLPFIFACGDGMVEKGIESVNDPRFPEINVKQGSVDILSEDDPDYEPFYIDSSLVVNLQARVTFSIENLGTEDLVLTGDPVIQIDGYNFQQFSVYEGPASNIIPPGRSETFTISFDPQSEGTKVTYINIQNNDFDESIYTYQITGQARPEINVKQGATDVTSDEGTVSISLTGTVFTIENTGSYDLDLTDDTGLPVISITGDNSDDFEVTEEPTETIKVGESTAFTITFVPQSEGDRTATVEIVNNDSNEDPYTFSITGYSEPEINVKQEAFDIPGGDTFSLDYIGGIDVGSGSNPKPFTIYNDGDFELNVLDITITGIDADEFSLYSDPSPYNVPAGDDVPFSIIFNPQDTARKTAQVIISSNDYDEGQYSFTITAISKPVPDFNSRLRKGLAPLTVNFENLSLPESGITSWEWNFGDGQTSTDENPIHIYSVPGTYSVTLGAVGQGGISYKIKSSYVVTLKNQQTVGENFRFACSVFTVDIDKDGDIDIVSAARDDDELAWWENDGSGIFGTKNSIDTNFSNASSVHAADIDGDGFIDIIAAGGNEVAWWKNDGILLDEASSQLDWTKNSIISTFTSALSVYVADLDNDLDLDVMAASDVIGLRWWTNGDASGNFSGATNIIVSGSDYNSIYAAEIDGIYGYDIIATQGTAVSGEVAWWPNDETNTFAGNKITIDSTFISAKSVYSADIDGDGDKDVISAASEGTHEIAWWENTDASGDFSSRRTIDSTFEDATSVFVSDLDNDGDMDVIGAGDKTIAWWENTDGSGVFGPPTQVAKDFYGACSVTAADIDGDSYNDIIGAGNWRRWSGGFDGEIAWWKIYKNWHKKTLDDSLHSPTSVHTVDIDNDGDMDIVGGSYTDGILWWENIIDNEIFTSARDIDDYESIPSLYDVQTYDIDNDGDQDVLSVTEGGVEWWENVDGNCLNWDGHFIGNPGGSSTVIPGDIDSDGDIDVVGTGYGSDAIEWYENIDQTPGSGDGDGTAWTGHSIDSWSYGSSAQLTDIDGDNDLDVIVNGVGGIGLWLNDGNLLDEASSMDDWSDPEIQITTFSDNWNWSGGIIDSLHKLQEIDMDQDGDTDIIAADVSDAGKVAWYENIDQTPGTGDGNGTSWSEHIIDNSFDDTTTIISADIDGDGDIDAVASSNSLDTITWWKNIDGAGLTWSKYTIISEFAGASSVSATDIDNDGDLDIIATARDADEIVIFENNLIIYGPDE